MFLSQNDLLEQFFRIYMVKCKVFILYVPWISNNHYFVEAPRIRRHFVSEIVQNNAETLFILLIWINKPFWNNKGRGMLIRIKIGKHDFTHFPFILKIGNNPNFIFIEIVAWTHSTDNFPQLFFLHSLTFPMLPSPALLPTAWIPCLRIHKQELTSWNKMDRNFHFPVHFLTSFNNSRFISGWNCFIYFTTWHAW